MSIISNVNKEKSMNNNLTVRHGEVILIPVSKVPKGKVEKHKSFIVGHSESGAHHVLESDVDYDVIFDKLEVYLLLNRKATLVHKKTVNKHRNVIVKPGVYRINHKVEYNPFTKATERVFD